MAYSAEHAVTLVERWNPEVAIIEFIVSGKNGLECANRLRDLFPATKILLFNAQVAEYLLEAASERGYETFKKPVAPRILLGACSFGST